MQPTWDVTVVDTLPIFNMLTTSVTPCRSAEAAAMQKKTKYASIIQLHIFVPIAIETLVPMNTDGQRFFNSLGKCLSSVFLAIQEKPHYCIREFLCWSKSSLWSLFMVLSSQRQWQKVNSRTHFNFVFKPLGFVLPRIQNNNNNNNIQNSLSSFRNKLKMYHKPPCQQCG